MDADLAALLLSLQSAGVPPGCAYEVEWQDEAGPISERRVRVSLLWMDSSYSYTAEHRNAELGAYDLARLFEQEYRRGFDLGVAASSAIIEHLADHLRATSKRPESK
jgi:hypothetical protein